MTLEYLIGFWVRLPLQIARPTLETRLLSELQEKDEKCFTGADATLDLRALPKKQEFCVEVFPNQFLIEIDFKTDSAKVFRVKVETLQLLESFEDCRELKELTAELSEEKDDKSLQSNEKEVMYESFE